MWARMTEDELLQRSDLIALGELVGTTRRQEPGRQEELLLGVIQVEEVLKGRLDLSRILLRLPSPGAPQVSTSLSYKQGQRGLWFLRAWKPEESPIYLADHPQRFLPIEQAAGLLDALRGKLLTSSASDSEPAPS